MSDVEFKPGDKVRRKTLSEYIIVEVGEWIVAEDQDGEIFEFDDDEIELVPRPPAPRLQRRKDR